MRDEDGWPDRFGDRAFDMLYSRAWGSLGWALIGAIVGAFMGALPAGLTFATWLVGCAAIGVIAWFAVALSLGLLAIVGWLLELVGLALSRMKKR